MIKEYVQLSYNYYSKSFNTNIIYITTDIDEMFTADTALVTNDKIYLDKSVILPRLKLRNLCKEQNIKIVSNISDANKIYINKDIFRIHNRLYASNNFSLTKETALELCRISGTDLTEINDFIEINKIENFCVPYYSVSDILKYQGSKLSIKCKNELEICISDEDNKFLILGDVINIHHIDHYKKIINSKAIIYNDQSLHKVLNNDRNLDEETYQNTRELLKSKDTDNTILAMEVMANCNFEKSAVYLLLLYSEFYQQIYNSPYRTNISFKTLTRYFNFTHILKTTGIIQKLKEKKLLTIDNLAMLIPQLESNYQDNIPGFKILSIEPTKELKDAIIESEKAQEFPRENIENICDKLTIDFTNITEKNENEDAF